MAIQIQVVEQGLALIGEAVHHGGGQLVPPGFQNRQETVVGVALMQEHRLAGVGGQRQLRFEGAFLIVPGGKIAVEVQAHFTGRRHLGKGQQPGQCLLGAGVEKTGVVRVNAGGGEQGRAGVGPLPAQRHGGFRLRHTGAGEQHQGHAAVGGAGQHLFTVLGELLVAKIDADVRPARAVLRHAAHPWLGWGCPRRALRRSRRSSTRRRLAPRSQ